MRQRQENPVRGTLGCRSQDLEKLARPRGVEPLTPRSVVRSAINWHHLCKALLPIMALKNCRNFSERASPRDKRDMPKIRLTDAAVQRYKAAPSERIEYLDQPCPASRLRVSGPAIPQGTGAGCCIAAPAASCNGSRSSPPIPRWAWPKRRKKAGAADPRHPGRREPGGRETLGAA
jgi:hypothetical protein